ncbi:MAG: metallophosphoesterase [Rhodococcus sp. (in: high G+C Gram-positive bacteria)]|uniref:metallophosphoesterase n=1 Tax=Rhodococcus sp. TaxID=1831 RepID=UPI002ADBE321|nr:metallophosphoesterase [Rhodococcus sp. (in: high G+C Gram-positive bacteria)]
MDAFQGVDVIGDVHGCSLSLEKLLTRMDYRCDQGVYRHTNRLAIFVGDIIDRGPHIREAVNIIRGMVDANCAICILGNHEFNAIAYTTVVSTPGDELQYLRHHNQRNNRLIAETLVQYASYPEQWRSALEWFQTLPIYLDMDLFRVVHACWDHEAVNSLRELNVNCVSEEFMRSCLMQNEKNCSLR